MLEACTGLMPVFKFVTSSVLGPLHGKLGNIVVLAVTIPGKNPEGHNLIILILPLFAFPSKKHSFLLLGMKDLLDFWEAVV